MEQESTLSTLGCEEVFQKLRTSSEGLSQEEVDTRQQQYGKNQLEEKKISKLKLFLHQFNNILIYILFAASIVSLLIAQYTDFFVINFIILLNGLIGFWQEVKALSSLEALKKQTETQCKVVREGEMQLIPSSELVPGDFIVLHEGEVASADIRLVECSGLMADESAITGESYPVPKDPAPLDKEKTHPYELANILFSGTTVVKGAGRGVVVRTGQETYFSSIAAKTEESSPETPLTRAIAYFAKRYLILVTILFSILGVIGYLQGRPLIELGYILLASLVSAVPEGLPIVITLVMVIGAVALSRKKTLVRYLPTVETLGSATVIASDKTGTITEGMLIVKKTHALDPELLKKIAALCNDAHEGTGDPVDVALADWVEGFEELQEKHPRKWSYAFDPKLRFMASVHDFDEGERLVIKGAYEALKERSENQKELEAFDEASTSFMEEGLRTLAFGISDRFEKDPSSWKIKMIGLIGFQDPPKKEVHDAVVSAKNAGIRVLMITGDHLSTAKAIAQKVAIWEEGDGSVRGKEIEEIPDEKLLELLKNTSVFARILPEHKYRIVKLLQEHQEVVAVTGDGINDLPALKAADIGIAMGSGTEAAKNASKMVITDNNLKVIVDAIKNARVIADNIRKIIYYLCSTSLQEICLISLAISFSLPVPISAIQILWINIVTDGVMDKTFAFTKEEGNVMQRKPKRLHEQFFDFSQVVRILFFGLVLGGATFLLYLHLIPLYPDKAIKTIIFSSIVAAQWANGIQIQKEKEPFFKNFLRSFTINPWIFAGMGAGILLQCLVIYLIPEFFQSVPLDFTQWGYVLLMFFTAFLVVEVRKWGEFLWRKMR